MKTVVICLHGLIKDPIHDFIDFKKYIEEHNVDLDVELVMLYDIKDKKTYSYKSKLFLLEKIISDYESKGYKIVLIGYSFSCGLTARMCKLHQIYKVVLVAPVLKIITKMGLKYYYKIFIKSLKMRAKGTVNKKKRKRLIKMNSLYLFDLLCSCFYVIHKTKRAFKYINCPTLCMIGKNDEITDPKYLCKIRKQIKSNINFDMRFYNDANHVFIMSTRVDKSNYYKDIVNFIGTKKVENNN